MMNTNDTAFLTDFLKTPKQITIVPHRNPDGDALGSCLGLYHVLIQLNHTVKVISPNGFRKKLRCLQNFLTRKRLGFYVRF